MNKMNFNNLVYENLTYALAGGVFLCVVMMTVMFLYIMNLRKRKSNNSNNSLANKICVGRGHNIAIDIENAMSESGRTSSSSVSIKSLNKKIHSIKRNQKSDRMEYYSKTGMPIGPLSALNIGTCNSVKIHENELLQRQQAESHNHFGDDRTRAKLLPGLGCLPDVKIHLSRGCGVNSKNLFNLNRLSCKKRLIEELKNNGDADHFSSDQSIAVTKNRSIKSSKALSKVMKRTELQNTNKKPTQSKKRMIFGSISFGSENTTTTNNNRIFKTGNSKKILGSTKSSPAVNPGFIIVDNKNSQDCSISGHPNNRHNRKSRKSIRSQNSVVCNLHLGFNNNHDHHIIHNNNNHLGAGNSFNFLQNINRSVKSNLSQNSQSILPSEIASFSAENQSAGMPKLHSLQSLDQFSEDSGFINNIVEQLQTNNNRSSQKKNNNNNQTECSKSFGIKSFSFKKSTKSNRSNSSQTTNTIFSLGQATCHSNMSPISVYQNRNNTQLPPIGSSNILQDDFDQAHLENIEVGNRQDMSISPPCSSYQSYGSSINHQPLTQKHSSNSNNSQNINNFHSNNIEPPKLVSIGYNAVNRSQNNNNSILKYNRYGSKIYQENSNTGRLNLELGTSIYNKVTLSGVQSVPLQTQFEKSIVYSSKETLDSIEENENNKENNSNKEKRSSPISFKPFSSKYVKNKLSEKFSRESKDSGITVSTNLSSTSDVSECSKQTKLIIKKKLTATSSCGHTLVASYGNNSRQAEMLGTTLDVNNLKKFKSEKVHKKKLEATQSIGELLKNSPRPRVNHGFLTFNNSNGSTSTLNTNSSTYGTHAPLTSKNSLIPDNFSSSDENSVPKLKGLSINCNSNLTLDDLKSQIKRNSCLYQRKMSIACGASPVPAAVTKAKLKPLSSLPPLGTPLMSPKFV